jgi:methionyl aminopeptidase
MLSNIFPPSVVSLPDAAGHFNPFPTYSFTGALRPSYPLSPRRQVPDKIRHPDYASHGVPKSEQVGGHYLWEMAGRPDADTVN